MMWSIIVLTSVLCGASGDAPREVWRFEALSNLYAPPLVEDMTDRPGREIIICDSEAGLARNPENVNHMSAQVILALCLS